MPDYVHLQISTVIRVIGPNCLQLKQQGTVWSVQCWSKGQEDRERFQRPGPELQPLQPFEALDDSSKSWLLNSDAFRQRVHVSRMKEGRIMNRFESCCGEYCVSNDHDGRLFIVSGFTAGWKTVATWPILFLTSRPSNERLRGWHWIWRARQTTIQDDIY